MNNKRIVFSLICVCIIFSITVLRANKINTCPPHGCYNALASSLLHGKFDLDVPVPEEIKKLTPPFDWGYIGKYVDYSILDLSLYKEKLYLYFGISPLVFYLPYHFFTHSFLNDSLVLFLFVFGTIIVSTFLLKRILENHSIKISDSFTLLFILTLSLANISPYHLSLISIHSLAICAATFFMILGIFLFYTLLNKNSLSYLIFFGSLFISLAFGARPTFLLSAMVLLSLFFIHSKGRNVFKRFILFFLPFIFMAGLIGYYNFTRFNNLFEFGFKYQLSSSPIITSPMSFGSIIPNIYFYFFYPPSLDFNFPFFHLHEVETPIFFNCFLPRFDEFDMGILFHTPIFLFLPFFFYSLYKKKSNVKVPKLELSILLLPGLINFCSLLFCRFSSLRYTYDYSSFLIILTFFLFFYLKENKLISKKLSILFIVFSMISIYSGFLVDRSIVLNKTNSKFQTITSEN